MQSSQVLKFDKSLVEREIEKLFSSLDSPEEKEIMSAIEELSKIPKHRIRTNEVLLGSYLSGGGGLIQKVVAKMLLEKLNEGR